MIGLGTPTRRDHFRGTFVSLAALQAALPTALDGDRAKVDPGSGSDAVQYFYDMDEGWIGTGSGDGGGTATVKKVQEFVADGIVDNWTVSNGTLDQIDFVVVGGIIMKQSSVSVVGQVVDLGGYIPDAGTSVEVHYFQDLSIGGGGPAEEGTVVYIDTYDATSNKLPGEVGAGAFTGTGSGGSVAKGNQWDIGPGSTLYPEGTTITAKIDNPLSPDDYIIKY